MVITSLAAGIGIFCLIVVAHDGWPRIPQRGHEWRMVGLQVALIYFIAMVPVPLMLLLFRRRLSSLPKRIRNTLAALACVVTLAVFGLFVLLIMRR